MMRQLLIAVLIFPSVLGLVAGCATSDTVSIRSKTKKIKGEYYSSKGEAYSACSSWRSKGGTWELKVDQFGLSNRDQKAAPSVPIELTGTSNIPKDDPSYRKGDDEMAFKLPLLSSGGSESKISPNQEVSSIGFKWLVYERRLCKNDASDINVVLGKEYLIDEAARVVTSKMPELIVKQRFLY